MLLQRDIIDHSLRLNDCKDLNKPSADCILHSEPLMRMQSNETKMEVQYLNGAASYPLIT